MTSAIKFLGNDGTLGVSSLAPDEVAKIFHTQLAEVQHKSGASIQSAVGCELRP